MEVLRAAISATPLFGFMLAAAAVALAAQASLMAAALRWRPRQQALRRAAEDGRWAAVAAAAVPRRHLEIAALTALLLVPAVTGLSVRRARGLVAQSISETRPAEKTRLLDQGLRGQLNAIPLGIVLEELTGALGVMAFALAFAARRQIAGLVQAAKLAERDPALASAWAQFPSPETETVVACACAVPALALLPPLQGAVSYCVLTIKRMAALADVDPEEKVRQLDGILLEARRALETGTAAGQLGLVLAIITCAGLLWWKSPARARRRWLRRTAAAASSRGARAERAGWAAGLACLLAALGLYRLAQPWQAENDLPWPPFGRAAERLPESIPTPALHGPDELQRAPVLELAPATARLDGADVDGAGLDRRLRPLRPAAEEVVVLCQGDTRVARLIPFLAAVRTGGFHQLVLAFVERETIVRPTFGTLSRPRATGARAQVEGSEAPMDPSTTVVRPEAFPTCGALAARLVDLRRQNRRVGLVVPLPAHPAPSGEQGQ